MKSKLPPLTLRDANEEEVKIDLSKELTIDVEDLDTALCQFPGKYAFVSVLAEIARLRKATAEQVSDEMEADKYSFYRRNPPDGIKVTDKAIKEAVESDKELREQQNALISYQHTEKLAEIAVRSFGHMKDCLLALARSRELGLRAQGQTGGVKPQPAARDPLVKRVLDRRGRKTVRDKK